MRSRTVLACACLLPLALAGCAGNHLYFGTGTSVGLDVSGTTQVPDHVSFAYRRSEIALVPERPDGSSHSVLGGIDSDVAFFGDLKIKQVFATGEAAKNVADRMNESTPAAGPAEDRPADDSRTERTSQRLVIVTGTTLGVELQYGQEALSPSLLVGYRRGEATVIAVDEQSQEVRSVYADISIDTTRADGAAASPVRIEARPTTVEGIRIVQRIATGEAAERLTANSREARDKVVSALGLSAAEERELAALRNESARLADRITDPAEQAALRARIREAFPEAFEREWNEDRPVAENVRVINTALGDDREALERLLKMVREIAEG